MSVELSDAADGYVVADAVQFELVTRDPIVMIDSPVNNMLSTVSSVMVKAVASGNTAGWGMEFVLNGDDAGSIKDYNFPYEQTYTGLVKAEYTVIVYLIDGAGVRQGISDQVGFGVGDLCCIW